MEDVLEKAQNLLSCSQPAISPGFGGESRISGVGEPIDRTESHEDVLNNSLIDSIFSSYRGILGIPTDEDVSILKRFEQKYADDLNDLYDRSQDLRLKIRHLCDALDETNREIQATKLRSATCRSLLAPIRSLPAEILTKIFRLAIPSSKKLMFSAPPLVLCQVSKLWKDVVYHDSSLWNCLSLVVPPSLDLQEEHRVLHNMQLIVRHSGNVPFEISISDTYGSYTKDGLRRQGSIMWYLAFLFSRCRRLSLSISDPTMARHIANEKNAVFSSLETLILKFNPPLSYNSIPSFVFPAPALRSVNLTVFHTHVDGISIPWHQLTSLSCTMVTGSDMNSSVSRWMKLVAECPNLENLEVYFQGNGATGRAYFLGGFLDQSLSLKPLRYLKNFVMRVGYRGILEFLLNRFDFPVLESFRLDSVGQSVRLFHSAVDTYMKDSLGQGMNFMSGLVRLSLIRVVIEDDCLLALLKFTPRIVFLDILRGAFDLPGRGYCPDDKILIDFLCRSTTSHANDPLLPHLRDLRLYFTEWHGLEKADPQRYAHLAILRYQWGVGNRQHGHGQPNPIIPAYPFRLYLKFEIEDWAMKDIIAQAIGPAHDTIFHPELARRYFLREGY